MNTKEARERVLASMDQPCREDAERVLDAYAEAVAWEAEARARQEVAAHLYGRAVAFDDSDRGIATELRGAGVAIEVGWKIEAGS